MPASVATPPPPSALPAAVAGLWRRLSSLASDISDWSATTPCPDWPVHDLVAHLAGLQSAMNVANAANASPDGPSQPAPPPDWRPDPDAHPRDQVMAAQVAARRGWDRERLLEEFHHAGEEQVRQLEATAAEDAWAARVPGPTGETSREGLARVRCFDLWVHLWDLSEAHGVVPDVEDTADGAAVAHGYVLGLLPWLAGKRLGLPEGASVRVTLDEPLAHDAALVVREGRAVWEPETDAGAGAVAGAPGALTLLVSGRGTPERWRDAGFLRWAGGHGEELVRGGRIL